MRLLIDSHVFVWITGNPGRMRRSLAEILSDTRNELLLSAVSVWELSIKMANGKLSINDLDLPSSEQPRLLRIHAELAGLTILEISAAHAERVRLLPYHHRDPFDRLLIAQALEEDLALVSRDAAFARYPELRRIDA